MNAYPVLDLLWRADLKDYIGFVNHTLSTIVRMPYTNSWRAGHKHKDCHSCTIPAQSGQIGIDISNELAKAGKMVIGKQTQIYNPLKFALMLIAPYLYILSNVLFYCAWCEKVDIHWKLLPS